MTTLVKLDKIKSLLKDSETLSTLTSKFHEAISKSNCDKHGLAFNADSRHSILCANVSLTGWTGYYGSSSCSTFVHLQSEKDCHEFFVKALNKNMKLILDDMAKFAKDEAISLKTAAEKEINDASEILNSLI